MSWEESLTLLDAHIPKENRQKQTFFFEVTRYLKINKTMLKLEGAVNCFVLFCKERPLTRACFCRFLSSMLLQKRMFVFVYSLLEYERLTVLNFLLNSSTCKCSGKLCHLWELIIFDNFKEDFIWPIGGVVIIEYSKTIFSWRWQSDRVSQWIFRAKKQK